MPICEQIGSKAASRYKSLRQCFLHIDADHDGRLDRKELHRVFRSFNMPEDHADRFFDILDTNGDESIDYEELRSLLGPYIQPGYQVAEPRKSDTVQATYLGDARETSVRARTSDSVQSADVPSAVASEYGEVIVERSPYNASDGMQARQLCEMIAMKAAQRHKSARECFRTMDHNKDNVLSKEEVVNYVTQFGFGPKVGLRIFESIARSHSFYEEGVVDYKVFMENIGRFIVPGYSRPASSAGGTPRSRPSSARATVGRRTPADHDGDDLGLSRGRPMTARETSKKSGPRLVSRPTATSGQHEALAVSGQSLKRASGHDDSRGTQADLRDSSRVRQSGAAPDQSLSLSIPSAHLHGVHDESNRARAEVRQSARGGVFWLPAPPPPISPHPPHTPTQRLTRSWSGPVGVAASPSSASSSASLRTPPRPLKPQKPEKPQKPSPGGAPRRPLGDLLRAQRARMYKPTPQKHHGSFAMTSVQRPVVAPVEERPQSGAIQAGRRQRPQSAPAAGRRYWQSNGAAFPIS